MAVVKKIGVHRVHPLFSLERNASKIRKKYAKLAISGVLRGAMHLLALVATPLCALTILSVMSSSDDLPSKPAFSCRTCTTSTVAHHPGAWIGTLGAGGTTAALQPTRTKQNRPSHHPARPSPHAASTRAARAIDRDRDLHRRSSGSHTLPWPKHLHHVLGGDGHRDS